MSATPRSDRAVRRWLAGTGVAALVVALLPITTAAAAALPTTGATVHDPPRAGHEITVFPSRDFVSVAGYAADETLTVEVHHSAARGGGVVSSQSGLVPQDDPATPQFDGAVEVNHPGGGCWTGVTPNIVADDVIRVVVDNKPDLDGNLTADKTTVADVAAGRPTSPAPGTVVVAGSARRPVLGADGTTTYGQIPLNQLEQRLVAPGQLFTLGGRRTLQAPGTVRATLAYDAPDALTWTATYTGLTAPDVDRALGAESRILWLGRDPLAANPTVGVEVTIVENGAGVTGGPAAPCTAPKEVLPPLPGQDAIAPSTPTELTATVSDFNRVSLSWAPSTDNPEGGVTNYGVYRNGVPIWTVQQPTGTAPAPVGFVDSNVPPGVYTYTVDAADAVDNRSPQSGSATATAAANPAAPPTDVPVSEPPVGHEIVAFPSRDFVDAGGFAGDEIVTMQVIRGGRLVTDATGLVPADDPATAGFDGALEVNHPGGGCWNGTTPDLRTGDVVRALAYGPDGVLRSVNQTTVANVTARKAVKVLDDDPATAAGEGQVTVKGTAAGHDGQPLPLGNIEQRLVSSSASRFLLSDRRTLLAPGNGTLAYDTVDNPDGTRWTATYSGLVAADLQRALDVESRILWLGRDPLAGNELTIFEVGIADPPGPAAGFCSGPLEPLDTTSPSTPTLSATPEGAVRQVRLAWTAATDDAYVYGYRLFRDGVLVRVVAGDVTTYTDTGVLPGTHGYAVEAFDSASARGAGATEVERLGAGLGQPYGNTSARSAAAAVTMPDVTAPSIPANLSVTNPTRTVTNADGTTSVIATNNALLQWDASTDDVAVTGYRVWRKDVSDPASPGSYVQVVQGATGVVAQMTLTTKGQVAYVDTDRTSASTYVYVVEAYDAAANTSARSDEATVKIGLDTVAPTVPSALVAATGQHGQREVVLSWTASTDDFLVTQYAVYRNGAPVSPLARVNGTTVTYTDVVPAAQTYTYTVDAADSAGNRSARSAAVKVVVANEPPAEGHAITAFPARDFVNATGYALAEGPVHVSVLRDGATISTSSAITPVDDANTPGFDGIVEVNHAGSAAGCWTVNTPDIRTGDVVRVTNARGVADQITVQGVTAQRPRKLAADTVQVKGTAVDAFGGRVPLGQLEQRLIANTDASFALNGRRALLAPGEGTLAYDDATTASWTATYTGLSAADVTRALGAESRALSLGRQPLLGNEVTIAENGPGVTGGPATPDCTAPLEPTAPQVSWTPNTLGFGNQAAVPASSSVARTVTFSNAGLSPVRVDAVYLAGANPGDYEITAGGAPETLAAGVSKPVSVVFSPKALGARPASLSFVTNGANTAYQTVVLSGSGVDVAAPGNPGRPVLALASGTTNSPALDATTLPVTITWAASTTGRLTHYQLQRATGTGAYADTVPQPAPSVFDAAGARTTTAASTVSQSVAPAGYRYQVRACNGTACTAWVAIAATATVAAAQESNAALSYGGTWSGTIALTGAFGGSVRQSSTAKSSVRYSFTGTVVQLVSTRASDRGRVSVRVDGGAPVIVDLYASTTATRQVVFSRTRLTAGTQHQIEVVVEGTRNASSTGTRVDTDALLTLR